jgi:hypothetical protein
MKRLTFFALLALTLFARVASAQDHSVQTHDRIALVVGGGFGGERSLHVNPDADIDVPTISADLDPSPVFGLRYIHAMSRYMTLASELRVTRYRADGADDRNTLFDFSVMPAGRFVIGIGSYELEPYLGVPLGLTVNLLDADPPGDLGRGSVGFHLGLLGGVAFHMPFGLGVFVEFGWLHHEAFDKDDADTRYRLVLNQAALNAGVSYAF